MMKIHVESNDQAILTRLGKVKVNVEKKTLRLSKRAVIGLKTIGRINFLTNHRGWTLVEPEDQQGAVNK